MSFIRKKPLFSWFIFAAILLLLFCFFLLKNGLATPAIVKTPTLPATSLPISTGDTDWTWQNPLPQGNNLNGVSCSGNGVCYAVGLGGTILKFSNNNWIAATPSFNSKYALDSISCPNDTFCMVVGSDIIDYTGGVTISFNGKNWTLATSATPYNLASVYCRSSTNCYAVGPGGVILTYNGTSWTPVTPSPTTHNLRSISCATASSCFAVGGYTGSWPNYSEIVQYDGTNWFEVPSPINEGLAAVACPTLNFCLAVSDNNKTLTYNGVAWSLQGSPSYSIRAITCLDANTCFGVGGSIAKYQNGTWVQYSVGNTALLSVACTSVSNCVAVGSGGSLKTYDGTNWLELSYSGIISRPTAISCISIVKCFAVGSYTAKTLFGYDGAKWSEEPVPQNGKFFGSIDCNKSGYCFAVGYDIAIYDGTNWSSVPSPTASYFNSISCPALNRCFAVGNDGAIITYDGTNWASMIAPTTDTLLSVSCPAITRCFAVNVEGAVISYDGASWTVNSQINRVLYSISCPEINNCIAVGDDDPPHGVLSRNPTIWSYNGSGWSQMAAPSAAKFLFSVSCPEPTRCFAVGAYGTAVQFVNNSWTLLTIGARASFVSVSCLSIYNCLIIGDGGAILEYNPNLVVTSLTDDGQGLIPGTLSYAINHSNPGKTITFNVPNGNVINVTGQLPSVSAGVNIKGKCSDSGPAITIKGLNNSGNGLTLGGQNILFGVKITGFGGHLLKLNGPGNKFSCVSVIK